MIVEQVSELELYVNQLQRDKKKIYNDYEELIKDLKHEFNIITTKQQLDYLYSPTLEEEIVDMELILKNVC